MPLKATLNCDCGESFGQYTIVSATAGLRRLRPSSEAPTSRPLEAGILPRLLTSALS